MTVAVASTLLLGLAALAIDIGGAFVMRAELQKAADSAALAGAARLPDLLAAQAAADLAVAQNADWYLAGGAQVVVRLGSWDAAQRTFSAGGSPPNALRVTLEYQAEGLFGAITGGAIDIGAGATAWHPTGAVCRMLIDSDAISPATPAIAALATTLGVDADAELLSDNDSDGYIDVPAGTELSIPSGTTAAPGVHLLTAGFPFSPGGTPSLHDFLRDLVESAALDPVGGVAAPSAEKMLGLNNLDRTYVSPVWQDQLSPTSGGFDASGDRRGLLAFKVKSFSGDPAGGGASITIEVVSPAEVQLDEVVLQMTDAESMIVE